MLSATLVTGCAPDMVRYGIFAIELSKIAPTHKGVRVAVCG